MQWRKEWIDWRCRNLWCMNLRRRFRLGEVGPVISHEFGYVNPPVHHVYGMLFVPIEGIHLLLMIGCRWRRAPGGRRRHGRRAELFATPWRQWDSIAKLSHRNTCIWDRRGLLRGRNHDRHFWHSSESFIPIGRWVKGRSRLQWPFRVEVYDWGRCRNCGAPTCRRGRTANLVCSSWCGLWRDLWFKVWRLRLWRTLGERWGPLALILCFAVCRLQVRCDVLVRHRCPIFVVPPRRLADVLLAAVVLRERQGLPPLRCSAT
jgi:hypothetical protein